MKNVFLSFAFVASSFLFVIPLSAAEYEVIKGDSLWKIAKDHETTVKSLKDINRLDSDLIFPEQVLKIDREITYRIKKGDTLSGIAVEHGVTIDDLKGWNGLESNLIITGDELKIILPEGQEIPPERVVEAQQTKRVQTQAESTAQSAEPVSTSTESSKQTMAVTATAYTATCDGCSGITATGVNLLEDRDKKVIAVDPSVIPLGTRVHVEGYGEAIAADTGGAIKGNKIDVHVPTKQEAYNWGVREVKVTILD
ncbi:3D domain-containing protein [Gracilibacillus sp. YIM 98692]|uniref:LysM peptidoglycan-binding and 3D domain-containing protein n=1 Tax=Gracilibacillus sp. YIM 98692 TaxID=2663532 RepID=UPI0013D0B670|nr:3D domain-containing protein [Gracilibacillus sp. YIM 98692]